jgi:hypothetical protein
MQKKSAELWNRPDRIALESQRGPLFEPAQRLSKLMHAERKHLTKQKDAGGTRFSRSEVEFYGDNVGERNVPQLVEVHAVKGDPNIYLAYDPDSRNDDMHRYSITPDGMISDIDMTSAIIEPESEEFARIVHAMDVVSKALESDKQRRERRSYDRRRVAKQAVASVVALAAVAGGVGYAVKEFIVDPRQAERERREAYDNLAYELPGEAAPIDTYEFGELPRGDFVPIPDFKDGETLANPRKVEIDSTSGCVTIDTKADYTEEFFAAVPNGHELREYTYQIDTTDSGIRLCVVDAEIGGKIAIQARPSGE